MCHAVHLLEDAIVQGLVKFLDVPYRVVFVGDAGLELDRGVAHCSPSLDRLHQELVVLT